MLGVVLDNKLQWHKHIDKLCLKLRSTCYAIRFLSNHCGNHTLLAMYYAIFHSHFRYGILNWGNSVHSLQKQIIRTLAGLSYRESCRDTFKKLKSLTVYGVYIMEVCIFAYKNRVLLKANRPIHKYDTRMRGLLPESHRSALYQRETC